MFHPNISKAGEICVDTLKKAWTRNLGIADVLVVSEALKRCGMLVDRLYLTSLDIAPSPYIQRLSSACSSIPTLSPRSTRKRENFFWKIMKPMRG
jgi:hypothetical protein